jgi:peptide/nickel transport system permease protein
MLQYIIQRVLQFIPLLVTISVLTFAIIELPPGDWLTMHIGEDDPLLCAGRALQVLGTV